MLNSFSYQVDTLDAGLYYALWCEIEKLRRYFRKFCGNNTDEAMQATLMHSLAHYSESKGEITAYVKKLARDITKTNGRVVFVDFLEQTLSDNTDCGFAQIDKDFSDSLVTNIYMDEHKRRGVAELALCYLDKFMLLCEAIITRNTATTYYPDVFIKECIRLSDKCDDFNKICVSIYNEHRENIIKFLNCDLGNQGVWRETDFPLISQSMSKRIKMVDPNTGLPVEDPDVDTFTISGKLGDKRVLRINYYSLWDKMCDLVECGTNVMRFTIDNSYIIRTLGGSMSVVNPDLFNIYDLCRTEILSNILHDLNVRCIGIGSENFYFITSDTDVEFQPRVIKGVSIDLKVEDITESL